MGARGYEAFVKMFEAGQNEMVYQLPPGTYEQMKKKFAFETRNAPMLGIRTGRVSPAAARLSQR